MGLVLVVEDELKVHQSLEEGLRKAGFQVETTATGNQGAWLATTRNLDCVILDWILPGRDGLQILSDLRRTGLKDGQSV